jgi:hypothetical protein
MMILTSLFAVSDQVNSAARVYNRITTAASLGRATARM